MIMIENRKLVIPATEKRLGYEGDNDVASRVFRLSDMALSELAFTLDVQKSDASTGIVALMKTVVADHIDLTWTLLASEMDVPGELITQLRAFNDDGTEIWHSGLGVFIVGASIRAEAAYPAPLPTEFQQFEANMTAAVQLVQSVSERIGEISQGADGVSVTGAQVLENGHLALSLSNGSTIDCGSAVGPRGQQGTPGLSGQPGSPGQAGQDGINGQDGQDGRDGADGYTPVRGVDYWTTSDVTAMENAIMTSLGAVAVKTADVEQKEMVVTYEDDTTETLKLVIFR